MTPRWRRLAPLLAALALLAAGGASMVHVSSRSSPVWDEINFYGLGAYYLEAGRFDIPGAIHPPLAAYLGALTLDRAAAVATGAFAPLRPGEPASALLSVDVARGNLLLRRLGLAPFLAARLPFILVYLLLAGLVFLWARRWYGDLGGLFSLALCLLCPNLMAHGYPLTTDLLVAALLFGALFFLFLAFDAPGPGPLVGFLACLALAPTAKLLGLLGGPGAALAVLWRAFTARELVAWSPGHGRRLVTRRGFLGHWALVGLAGALAAYAALVLVYQGDLALQAFRLNLALIGEQLRRGHPVFLDGQVSQHGFATYYLRAIPYKTSLAVLAAWVLSALVPGPRRVDGWAPLALLGAGAVLFVSASGYTLGLRYALVFFPLLYVAAGRLAATGGAPRPEARRRLGLCALAVATCLVEQAGVYPWPRAFVNRALVRGPSYDALADTDLDWGEGLFALRDFVRDRGLGTIALSYHGSASPRLFDLPLSWFESTAEDVPARPPPRHGWLFVSATNLSGLYFPDDRWAWLRGQPPQAVVGGTIYAFDLDRLPPGVAPPAAP